MTQIVQDAEKLLADMLKRTAEPTQYIASFRTPRGRELALQRNREEIYVWTEHLENTPTELAIEPKFYPKDKSRSANLNDKNAPRLKVGKAVDYWKLETLEQLRLLANWYQQQ